MTSKQAWLEDRYRAAADGTGLTPTSRRYAHRYGTPREQTDGLRGACGVLREPARV